MSIEPQNISMKPQNISIEPQRSSLETQNSICEPLFFVTCNGFEFKKRKRWI